MINDDHQTGRLLSRREIIALFGSASAIMLVGCDPVPERTTTAAVSDPSAAPCIVRPAQTEGPFFVDEHLERSDIRSDPTSGKLSEGLPLDLTLRFARVQGTACVPLAGAVVDLWHCDAAGAYSDVRDPHASTVGSKFLRGYQVTDAKGQVRFLTIYPGWYGGRTVHIHLKVRLEQGPGMHYDFTSQLYFDDAFTDRVHALPPYASRGKRAMRNDDDGIYRRGGDRLLLPVTVAGAGYTATFGVGMQLPG